METNMDNGVFVETFCDGCQHVAVCQYKAEYKSAKESCHNVVKKCTYELFKGQECDGIMKLRDTKWIEVLLSVKCRHYKAKPVSEVKK